jgi:hypothetical protein
MKLFANIRLGIVVIGITLATLVVMTWVGYLVWPAWSVNASTTTPARPEQVWAWYSKPADNPRWNPLVKQVVVHGPFALGTTGADTWFDGSTIPWQIVRVQRVQGYTQIGNLPFAEVTSTYYLMRTPRGTRIDLAIQVDGVMAWFYGLTMRKEFDAGVNAATRNLAVVAARGLPGS